MVREVEESLRGGRMHGDMDKLERFLALEQMKLIDEEEP